MKRVSKPRRSSPRSRKNEPTPTKTDKIPADSSEDRGFIDLSTLTESMEPRHVRFAYELLVDDHQTAAAKRAGFSESNARDTGYHLATRKDVQTLMTALRANRARRLGIDADMVMLGLWHEAMHAKESRERIAAFKQIARMLGLDGPLRLEHTGPGGSPLEVHVQAGVSQDIIQAIRQQVLGVDMKSPSSKEPKEPPS